MCVERDLALARLGKSVRPGCERAVDVKDTAIDYCPHGGIGLFDRCGCCATRKNAFRAVPLQLRNRREHDPRRLSVLA